RLRDVVGKLGTDVEGARSFIRAGGSDGVRLLDARDRRDDRVRAQSKSERDGHRSVLGVRGGDADQTMAAAVERAQRAGEGSRGVQTLAEAVDQNEGGRTHGSYRLVARVGKDRTHERRTQPKRFPERVGATLVLV